MVLYLLGSISASIAQPIAGIVHETKLDQAVAPREVNRKVAATREQDLFH